MNFTVWSVIGLFLSVFVGGYLLIGRIRRQAEREGKLKEKLAEHEAADKRRKKVDKLANKVDAMPDDKVRKELGKWSRD
jgi:predicted exporter